MDKWNQIEARQRLSEKKLRRWAKMGVSAAKITSSQIPVSYSSDDDSDGGSDYTSKRRAKRKFQATFGKIFLFFNLFLEILAAVFDQLSSPSDKVYALIGASVSLLAVIICIGELVYKGRKEKVTWKAKKLLSIFILGWFYHLPPRDNKPFGSFPDIFGAVCAIFQFMASVIQCICIQRYNYNPIKLSVLPIVFAICLVCSKMIKTSEDEGKNVDAEMTGSWSC